MDSFIWNVFIGSTGWNTFTTSPTMTLICQYEYLLKGGSQSALTGTERSKLGRVSEDFFFFFFCHMCCERVIPGHPSHTKEGFEGQCLYFCRRFYFFNQRMRRVLVSECVTMPATQLTELRKWNEVFQHNLTHEIFYNASIMAWRKWSLFQNASSNNNKLTNKKRQPQKTDKYDKIRRTLE